MGDVWDFVGDSVLILTNYHTWEKDFASVFPPTHKKRKKNKTSDEEIILRLTDSKDFSKQFNLDSSLFSHFDKDSDYAVLKLSSDGFNMQRIPIDLCGIDLTLKVRTIGFVGHHNELSMSFGEVSSVWAGKFSTTLISAPGYSGAAVVSDGYGRAVGYMFGNFDTANMKNSQHQSLAYKFDDLVKATKRRSSPSNSPIKSSSCSSMVVSDADAESSVCDK